MWSYEDVPNRNWSLARQLLALQAVLLLVLVGAGVLLAYLDADRATEDHARQEVTAVAATVADSPSVRTALRAADPSAELQPFAERVRGDTGVDFITIMAPDGTRYTHPDPDRIGQRFIGNTEAALRGRMLTETYTGTLGPSIRAVAPVFDADRDQVVALVAVGITVSALSAELAERLPPLLIVAGAVLVVGLLGSYLVSARLRRQTRGVAPAELSGMFEYYSAILHSVREGLVLIGRDGRVVLCNDAARELLDLEAPVRDRPVEELGLAPGLVDTFISAGPRTDEIHVTGTRVLVVNTAPVRSGDRAMGTVVTLRDHTELQSLTGELDTMRGFAESLRSQAHEAANRLHAVVSLVELGRIDRALEFATAELAAAQQLTDRVVGSVSEPVLAALLLGKSAEADERGVDLVLTEDTATQDTQDSGDAQATGIDPRDLVTILGNLIDNAVDAAVQGAGASPGGPRVTVTVRTDAGELFLRVADSGPGVDAEAATEMFRKGWSTKPAGGPMGRGLGLALVGQAVRRYGGTIDVGQDEGAVFTVRLPVPAPRKENR
ncbi:Sensor histidine kinase regulating citrate/malate metabolism [Amycolatopsis marina]|uniref:histidine kinase n=1 Tax=Amycolatopsis marina TaxID=490629 RepID=A0A1I1BUP3_9PSEU|nr:sensor histidine kinase [Amycolatopsis marina]SFB52398.1 Sensor histidine kinase regulating citrate/malate metabolism [Amycolatopsis marina]